MQRGPCSCYDILIFFSAILEKKGIKSLFKTYKEDIKILSTKLDNDHDCHGQQRPETIDGFMDMGNNATERWMMDMGNKAMEQWMMDMGNNATERWMMDMGNKATEGWVMNMGNKAT